jgi:molybdopterin adenylyltransferase
VKGRSRAMKHRFSAAVLIASDRSHRGTRPDETGPILREYLVGLGYDVVSLNVVPDDSQSIIAVLQKWVREDRVNLILVSGGTGLAPRDVTPEATLQVIERRIPGMEEAMRRASFEKTPHAILSRAVVGCVGDSLIVNLPGNPKGALENLQVIEPALEHALELITGGAPDP